MTTIAHAATQTDGPLTPAQQSAAAIKMAQGVLLDATNAKLLQAVLLEVAAQWLFDDPTFVSQVLQRYTELSAPRSRSRKKGANTTKPKATPKVSDYLEPLIPIKHIPNFEVSLDMPPDPYLLLDVFGAHQLVRALNQRSPADVRKAAAMVQARNPGTAPKTKSTKGLISYIVDQVAG